MPFFFNSSKPFPKTLGLGSLQAATTTFTPEFMISCVHAWVLPLKQQGSSVTYIDEPFALPLAFLNATTSA